jgi:hypothetical protein
MEDKTVNRKVVRIAIAGAIFAVAVDYFLQPSVNKTLGFSKFMAFPLPFTPPITTGGPHLPTVDDKLVKDKKVRASKLIRTRVARR